MSRNTLQLAIYFSALGVAAGVFLPLTSFPVYGDVSYFRIARLEACLVIVFALCAPALILAGRPRLGILCPVGVWGVLLYPALEDAFGARNNNTLQKVGDGVSSAMTDFSADLFLNIAEFEWGGLGFLLALLVFTLAGVVYRIRC